MGVSFLSFIKSVKLPAALGILIFSSASLKASGPSIQSRIEEINRLVLDEKGQNSIKVSRLDKKIEKLGARLIRQKSAALGPLSRVVLDSHWPLKTRVFCINFLGLMDDPGAFTVLSQLLLDPSQPDVLRSQAASLLPRSPVSIEAKRKVLCRNYAQKNLPELTKDQTLFEISKFGCPQVDLLLKQTRDFGDKPEGKNRVLAILSIQALGESFSSQSLQVLWKLFDFYSPGSLMRGEVLKALLRQSRRRLPRSLISLSQPRDAVASESRFPENEKLALKVLVHLGGKNAAPDIQRELKNPNPDVRAAAKKALEKIR